MATPSMSLSLVSISIFITALWASTCVQHGLAVPRHAPELRGNFEGAEPSDMASFLQSPPPKLDGQPPLFGSEPHVIGLRRESVPIYRRGKIASFKTSYSGLVHIGSPAQEFRVVFDTGSGNVVLPAADCESEACLVHRRYDMFASQTAVAVNTNGSLVEDGTLCDQVTIGFGTGQITGEFSRDMLCFNTSQGDHTGVPGDGGQSATPGGPKAFGSSPGNASSGDPAGQAQLCVEMHLVMAVEMSTQPFKSFNFDGILGLGLSSLAMTERFSMFDMLVRSAKLTASYFSFFLTEGDDGEESEIAIGGINAKRLLGPLSWAPVANADLGYWQVSIVAVRINGQTLDFCRDGTCRGVVDTGTSHLGVPAPYDADVANLLTVPSEDLLDCRLAKAPTIEIELSGFNVSLHPYNYMRRLPLREGIAVGSVQGVYVPSNDTNATLLQPSSADAVPIAAKSHTGPLRTGTGQDLQSREGWR